VTTRHVFSSQSDGVTFRARLDDEAISLIRTPAPVGTKIRIHVPKRLQENVKQIVPDDWEESINFNNSAGHYFLRQPSLKREFSNRSKKFEPAHWLPLPTDGNSRYWRCISNADFEKIFWSYRGSSPRVACNGIVILAYRYSSGSDSLVAPFYRPNLSIFDKNGLLPVNLQRTDLQSSRLPFHEDLVTNITDDLIAYALTDAPEKIEGDWFDGKYEGFSSRTTALYGQDQWARWLIGRDGFVLNDPGLLRLSNAKIIIVAIGGPAGYQEWGEDLRKTLPADVLVASYVPDCLGDSNPRIKGLFQDILYRHFYFAGAQLDSYLSIIPSTLLDKVKLLKPGRRVARDLKLVDQIQGKRRWKTVHGGSSPPAFLEEALTSISVNDRNPTAFCAIVVKDWETNELGVSASRWMKVLQTPFIPFNKRSRKKLEVAASEEIASLINLRRAEVAKKKKQADGNRITDDDTT